MSNIFRKERPTNFKLAACRWCGSSYSVCVPDVTQRPASATSAVTSKVKGQGHKVTWRVWEVLADKSRTKVRETPKLVGKLSTRRAIKMFSSFKVKGQRSRSPGRLMLRSEVRNIFRTGRPTNFKLDTQTEHEDRISDKRCDLQGQMSRLPGHVMRLKGVDR